MRERSRSSDRHRSDRRRSKKKKKSSRKEKSLHKRSRSRSTEQRRSSSRSRYRSPRYSRRSKSPKKRCLHSSREVSRSRSRSPRHFRRSKSPKRKTCHSSRDVSRSRSRSPRHSRSSRSPVTRSRQSSTDSSRSRSRERLSSKSRTVEKPVLLTPEELLKQKVERALKAAADADAQLRGIGVLNQSAEKDTVTSISNQLSRVNTIDEINSSGFQQQTFMSSRGAQKQQTEEDLGVHDSAIFGGGKAIVSTDIGNKSTSAALVLDENNLAHEKLCLNMDKKKERWNKKLMEMRRALLA